MKIAILAGGLSPERDVSLVSGGLIAEALAGRHHRVILTDVYEGVKIPDSGADSLFTDSFDADFRISEQVPDLDSVRRRNRGRSAKIGEGVLEVCADADAVFLALHGDMGEDGRIQATLDNYGIKKYTGSGYIGSLLAMDKDISKRMMRQWGILTPDWIYYDTAHDSPGRIAAEIGFPCVIKPSSCGSSVGVSIVENEQQLGKALESGMEYETKLIAEKKISGREFSVGILGNTVLPPIEIIPKTGFYDYKNKYQQGCTDEICPAALTAEQNRDISECAMKVFRCHRLSGYGRADFIMDSDGRFWCLEINNLPGMTPISLLPREAKAVGIDYGELCERIIELALEK